MLVTKKDLVVRSSENTKVGSQQQKAVLGLPPPLPPLNFPQSTNLLFSLSIYSHPFLFSYLSPPLQNQVSGFL